MYENKKELLTKLEFGSVDSESETDLDKKFIKTKDFEQFVNPRKSLVLGAKGSGKSALFQMFSKYEEKAKELAKFDNKIIIVTGTGFNDLKELQTDDFTKLLKNAEADFNKIWELYIAVKIAIKLGKEGYYCGDNLVEFYRHAGIMEDFRILNILKQLWSIVVGTPIQGIDIDIKGVKIKIGGKYSIDLQDMLGDINDVLEQESIDCWILFDKIDELFSNDYGKRKKLSWDKKDLLLMLMHRCLNNKMVEEYVSNKMGLDKDELLLYPNLEETFYTIFARQVYKGKNEANMIDWLLQRITDGLDGKYPREFINFANYSKEVQEEIGNFEENCLKFPNCLELV